MFTSKLLLNEYWLTKWSIITSRIFLPTVSLPLFGHFKKTEEETCSQDKPLPCLIINVCLVASSSGYVRFRIFVIALLVLILALLCLASYKGSNLVGELCYIQNCDNCINLNYFKYQLKIL